MTTQNETTQDDNSVQTTGGSVTDVTSSGDTAKDELDNAVAEGVFPATGAADSTHKSVGQLMSEAHAINDQATLGKLTQFIMDRDPAEYAEPENRHHATFLAADIMKNFDVTAKAAP